MSLAQEDIEYIQSNLGKWLAEQSLAQPPMVYEIELRERMIRLEEELKHQRELMLEGFKRMDQRFGAMQAQMNMRFEAIQTLMDKRFAAVDKRFEAMEKRFEAVDKRFEAVDKRFEAVDKRFEAMNRRLDRFMIWSFSTTLTVGGLVVATLKLWP